MIAWDYGNDGYYLGCYPRQCLKFDYDANIQDFTPTPISCTRICQVMGFSIAGLYNQTKCSCSCEQDCQTKLDDTYCGVPCRNQTESFCGGYIAASVYRVGPPEQQFSLHSVCNRPTNMTKEQDKDGVIQLVSITVPMAFCLLIIIIFGVGAYCFIRRSRANPLHNPTALDITSQQNDKDVSLTLGKSGDRTISHYEDMDAAPLNSRRPVSSMPPSAAHEMDIPEVCLESSDGVCPDCRQSVLDSSVRKLSLSCSKTKGIQPPNHANGETPPCTSTSTTINETALDPWGYSTNTNGANVAIADEYGYIELDIRNPAKDTGVTCLQDGTNEKFTAAPISTSGGSLSQNNHTTMTLLNRPNGKEDNLVPGSVPSGSPEVVYYSRFIPRTHATTTLSESSEESGLACESTSTSYIALNGCPSHHRPDTSVSCGTGENNNGCVPDVLSTSTDLSATKSSSTISTREAGENYDYISLSACSAPPTSEGRLSHATGAKATINESDEGGNGLDSELLSLMFEVNDRSRDVPTKVMTPSETDKDIDLVSETGLGRKGSKTKMSNCPRISRANTANIVGKESSVDLESQPEGASSDEPCFIINPKTRKRPSIRSFLNPS